MLIKIHKTSNETMNCQTFPFDLGDSQIGGHSFVKNGRVYFLGGYNFIAAWTSNFRHDQIDQLKSHQTQVGFLRFRGQPNPDFFFEGVDHTRYIGSSFTYIDELKLSLTFGGLEQQIDFKRKRLFNRLSNKYYIHFWDQPHPYCIDGRKNSETFHYHPRNIDNSHIPCQRAFHSTVWDPINKCIWLFGGITSDEYLRPLNDLWKWKDGDWELYNYPEGAPSPRYGASMAYLNNTLYVFGGYIKNSSEPTFYKFDILDKSWHSIAIPSEISTRSCGAQIFASHNKIFFLGGCSRSLYSTILNLKLHNPTADIIPETMKIYIYSPIENEYYIKSLPFPEVAYHSAVIDDEYIFFVGGVEYHTPKHANNDLLYRFHTGIRAIPLTEVLPGITTHPKIQTNVLISNRDDNECLFFPHVQEFIHMESKPMNEIPRIIELSCLFNEHQINPTPIKDFYCIKGIYGQKSIIQARIHNISIFYSFSNLLIRDLIMFLYTDIIDDPSPGVGIAELRSFIEVCVRNNMMRLAIYEVATRSDGMAVDDFFSICSIGDLLSSTLVQSMLQKVAMSNLYRIPSFLLKQTDEHNIAHIIFGPPISTKISIPESTILRDLGFVSSCKVNTSTGMFCLDSSYLEFDPKVLSSISRFVLDLVASQRVDILFSGDNFNEMKQMFELLNAMNKKIPVSEFLEPHMEIILKAFESPKRRNLLLQMVPSLRRSDLYEYILRIIGGKSDYHISARDCTLPFSQDFLITITDSHHLYIDEPKEGLFILVSSLYYGQPFYPKHMNKEFAQSVLIRAASSIGIPYFFDKCCDLLKEVINNKAPENLAKHFHLLFHLNLHTKVIDSPELKKRIASIISERYMSDMTPEMILWFMNDIRLNARTDPNGRRLSHSRSWSTTDDDEPHDALYK